MKPNPKITKKVSESIADLRLTLIQSTVQMCRQRCTRRNDIGEFKLSKPVVLASNRVARGRIVTESTLVDRVYYWYGDNYYLAKYGDGDGCAASDSKNLSLDSLVAVYEAVKKTMSKL